MFDHESPKVGLRTYLSYLRLIYYFIVKSHYYDDQKSRNIIIKESNNLEMTGSKNHDRKS